MVLDSKGILSLVKFMLLSLKSCFLPKRVYGGQVELNASKLLISEECVQKHVYILCIRVVLSHHILGFPCWRESITDSVELLVFVDNA